MTYYNAEVLGNQLTNAIGDANPLLRQLGSLGSRQDNPVRVKRCKASTEIIVRTPAAEAI